MTPDTTPPEPTTLRVATFNASLNRTAPSELIADLATPEDRQPATVAEIIQRSAPDALLVNEFDYAPYGVAADLFRMTPQTTPTSSSRRPIPASPPAST